MLTLQDVEIKVFISTVDIEDDSRYDGRWTYKVYYEGKFIGGIVDTGTEVSAYYGNTEVSGTFWAKSVGGIKNAQKYQALWQIIYAYNAEHSD